MNIQVEGDISSIGFSLGPILPLSSPNTSLQVTPSRGSDQKLELSSQSSGSFSQNPDNDLSLGPTLPLSSPNTSLQVTPSPGSANHKLEVSSQSSPKFQIMTVPWGRLFL